MRCLTLHQPWASATVVTRADTGRMLKTIETRSWAPAADMIGARLAIAAGKAEKWKQPDGTKVDLRAWWMEQVKRMGGFRACFEKAGLRDWTDLPRGVVLGHFRLAWVKPTEQLVGTIDPLERAWGDYSPGRFGWGLEDPVVLAQPVPITGKQGIYWWDEKEAA